MGSRGAFENVDLGNFHFKEGGQNYHSVGEVDGIQVIIQDSGSVKAPEFSHTANRSYAIVQNGKLKHLTFYDETHSQVVSIDLMHQHHGLMPHKHLTWIIVIREYPFRRKKKHLLKK